MDRGYKFVRYPYKTNILDQDYGNEIVVLRNCNQDANVTELLESFKRFLLASGYHPDNVNCIDFVETGEVND
jgi:Tat protein secretion system quality control protein TatD with DNase activity